MRRCGGLAPPADPVTFDSPLLHSLATAKQASYQNLRKEERMRDTAEMFIQKLHLTF